MVTIELRFDVIVICMRGVHWSDGWLQLLTVVYFVCTMAVTI